jgi:hypothetical protein
MLILFNNIDNLSIREKTIYTESTCLCLQIYTDRINIIRLVLIGQIVGENYSVYKYLVTLTALLPLSAAFA